MTDILYNPGTALTFKSSGGSAVLTPTSVTTGAGRISARYDRGSGALPSWYQWDCTVKTAAAATIGRALRLYWAGANASTGAANTDGGFSESDQAVSSADLLRNLQPMGLVVADTTANPGTFVSRGLVEIRNRYIQVAFWNDLNATLSSTATDLVITLTPVPDSF